MKRKIILLITVIVTLTGIITYDKMFKDFVILNAEDKMFAMTLDGEKVESLPSSGRFILDTYTCKKNSVLSWNMITRKISFELIDEEESCMLNFIENNFIDQSISYSGNIKEVTLTKGKYKLEVWGAQGKGNKGGLGGYSVGIYNIPSPTTVYVVVGGNNGYNGGGSSSKGYNGGGATHIATRTGLLSALSSYKSSVLMVAGGGGGMSYRSYTGDYYAGGFGGGTNGGDGKIGANDGKGAGGTQTSGGTGIKRGKNGSFGKGGDDSGEQTTGAGGGGYYGGSSGGWNYVMLDTRTGSGGGGSGYVSSVLTDAQTIAGNEAFPSTSGVTETGHSGNGYAKITLVG